LACIATFQVTKPLMSNNSLADKIGIVALSRILTTVVELALTIMLVRLLSKNDVAIITYLMIIYQTARYIASLGFPDSVFYFFERVAKDARKAFALQTCGIMGATGLVSGVVIFGLQFFADSMLGSEWTAEQIAAVVNLLPFIAVIATLEIPTWPVTNILLASDKQKQAAWYQLLNSLVMFTALIGPLFLGYGLKFAVFGLMTYAAIRFVGSAIWLNISLPSSTEQPLKDTLKRQINFSIPLGLSSLVGRLNKYIDKFVVSFFLPAQALAEYNVGAQEIPLIAIIPYAVGAVLISRYVRFVLDEEKSKLLELWYKGIQKVSILVVPLGVLFIAIANDFVITVFGAEYQNAVIPFQIYTLIILHRVTSYGSILQSFGANKTILQITAALLCTNFALSIPFTIWFGINGTAAATFCANMLSWYLALKAIGKRMSLPFYKVLPFLFYGKVLLLSTICGVTTSLLRTTFLPIESTGFGLLAGAIFYLLLFAVSATVLNIIKREDWDKILGWLTLGRVKKTS